MTFHFWKTFAFGLLLLTLTACGGSSSNSDSADEQDRTDEDEQVTEWLRFNIAGSTVLQTFERASDPNMGSQNVFTFSNDADDTGEDGNANLIAIDVNGDSRVAIESELPVSIAYTMLSHDGERVYVALENVVDEAGDTSQIIATLNCGLLAVSISTNDFECIAEGVEVEPMASEVQEIGTTQDRPLVLDELGNLYFAGLPFTRECNDETDICMMTGHGAHQQIFKYEIASENLESLTGEVPGLFSFQVMSNDRLIWFIPDYYSDVGYHQLYLFDQGNITAVDDENAWSQFYLIDDEATVVFTHSLRGFGQQASFAEVDESGTLLRTTLDLYGYKLDDRFTHNNNSLFRFVRGDDDALYGMFNDYDQFINDEGEWEWRHTYNAFRLLPYDPEPLYQVRVPDNFFDGNEEDNAAMSHTMPIIVKDEHTYYLGFDVNNATEGYFSLNVTRHDSPITERLVGGEEGFDPRFYRWRVVGDMIYFIGRNLSSNDYFLGTIDTAKIVNGDENAVAFEMVDTLGRGQANLRDFEVLSTPSTESPKDTAPELELLTTVNNPYSITLQFDRPMNRQLVNAHLTLMHSTGVEIPHVSFWLGHSLHLIPDQSATGLLEYGGQPLAADTSYELHLDEAIEDRWGNQFAESVVKTFYLDPTTGWVLQSHTDITRREGVSEQGFARYLGENPVLDDGQNPDWPVAFYQVHHIGNEAVILPENFQIEFSARQLLGWGSIIFQVRAVDNEHERFLFELHDHHMQTVFDAPGFGGVGARVEHDQLYEAIWRRYRFELFGEQLRFLVSDDGESFVELEEIHWPVNEQGTELKPLPRESEAGYEVSMILRTPFMLDDLVFRALDDAGNVEAVIYQQDFNDLDTSQVREILRFLEVFD